MSLTVAFVHDPFNCDQAAVYERRKLGGNVAWYVANLVPVFVQVSERIEASRRTCVPPIFFTWMAFLHQRLVQRFHAATNSVDDVPIVLVVRLARKYHLLSGSNQAL